MSSNLDSHSIMNKLNDDCIQKIFRFLHVRDLCNVANVCRRLKRNAEEVFQSLHSSNLDMLKLVEDFYEGWFMVRWQTESFFDRAEQLLRTFGRFIKAIRLTGTGKMGGMDENKLLVLVKTYCSSLKEMALIDIGRHDDFSCVDLRPMFGGLDKLTICADGVCDSFIAVLSDCDELKYLHVEDVPAVMWMDLKFPKLETLIISDNTNFDYGDFESFLKVHEHLRTLKFNGRFIWPDFFRILLDASPKIETFHFQAGIDDFYWDDDDYDENDWEDNLLKLSKLKSLRNFASDASAVNLLADAFDKENTPIEELEIFNSQVESEHIIRVSKLKSLKKLKLSRCEMTETTIMSVNTHLNGLNEVTIKDMEGLDSDRYIPLASNVRVITSKNAPISKQDNQNSAIILNRLNDDCLMAIFELLPLADLCNAADTCKVFRKNAQRIFELHYASLNSKQIIKSGTVGRDYTDMQMAEQLFRNFGIFIHELYLKGGCLRNYNEHESIMYLATKYCISIAFKTLTLDEFHINDENRWLIPLLGMFHRLPKLELHSCRVGAGFGKFLSICRIPMIQVFALLGSTDWMNYTFPYLQCMIMYDSWQPDDSALDGFLKLNGHLQTLSVQGSQFSSKLIKTVVKNMPRLQAFYFTGRRAGDRKIRRNVLHLTKLKHLTNLKLSNTYSVKELIDEFARVPILLAELAIRSGTVDMQLLEKLSNLKSSLKSLHLVRVGMKGVSLNDIVTQLPDLTELHIGINGIESKDIIKMLPFAEKLTDLSIDSGISNVQIDIQSYQSILGIVKSRQKPNSLCIHITSEDRHVFVPHHMLQESVYWLKIENEIIDNLRSVMSDSESEADAQDSESSDDASDTDSPGSESLDEESDNHSVMSVEHSDDTIDMEVA